MVVIIFGDLLLVAPLILFGESAHLLHNTKVVANGLNFNFGGFGSLFKNCQFSKIKSPPIFLAIQYTYIVYIIYNF